MSEGLYKKSVGDSIDPHLPGKKSRDAEKAAAAADARARLRGGEDAAADGSGASGENDASGLENGGFYAGAGGAIALDPRGFSRRGRKAKGSKGKFKKYGPIIGIAMAIFGGGAAIGGIQSLMPFHVVEQVTEMFDGSFTSRANRLPKMMKNVANMDGKEDKVTQKHLFSDYKKYRRGLKKYKKKLAAQGIEMKNEGKKVVLEYTNRAGNKKTVSADDFDSMYKTNTEFRNDFNRGTRSFSGRIAAWIDLSAARFLSAHGLTKNLWADWQRQTFEAEGKTTKFKDIIRGRRPDVDFDVGKSQVATEYDPDTDDEGHVVADKWTHSDSNEANSKVNAKTGFADHLASVARGISDISCAKAAVVTTAIGLGVSMMHEYAQDSFHGVAESTDKVKAGDGAGSPIHETGNFLINKMTAQGMIGVLSAGSVKPVQNESLSKLNLSNMYSAAQIGAGTAIACSAAKIAMASVSIVLTFIPGVSAFKGGFSVGKTILGIGKSAAISMGVGLLASWGISKFLESVTTNLCLDSGENKDDPSKPNEDGGNCLAIGGSSSLQTNFQNGGGTLASKDKISDFYDAQKLALQQEAEYDRATKSPFDATNSNTFLGSIVKSMMLPVAGLTTSPAGFIGSLGGVVSSSLASLLPTASAIDKAEYLATQIGDCPAAESIGAVGNSLDCSPIIISDMDTIEADPEDIVDKVADLEGFEMDGNKIAVDENGIEKIKKGSNLDKYIRFCSYRATPFGIVDQNITNEELKSGGLQADTGNDAVDTAIDSVAGAIPVVGDLLDILAGEEEIKALQWSTGANCVARDDDNTVTASSAGIGAPELLKGRRECKKSDEETRCTKSNGGTATPHDVEYETLSWKDEMRYYQRYVEDDRLVQSVDSEHSAVDSYLSRYEEENPVDNSFEGTLARKTGMTKEQVSVTLNELAYWEYLADYEPSDLYPVPVENKETISRFSFDSVELPDNPDVKLANRIVYAPLKDRNFVM